MCSASTAYTALKDSGLKPGQFAIFPGGGGGVGIQGVQLAVAMGMRAIVIDTGDERRKMCEKYGAEAFVDFKEVADPCAEVVKLTDGIGAHGVFVTAVQSYPTALGYLGGRIGGVVMWYVSPSLSLFFLFFHFHMVETDIDVSTSIGLPPAGQFHIDLDPTQLSFKNQSIKGTLVSGMADVDATLDFARRGKLNLEATVVGLSKFNESVQKLRAGQVAG